MNSYLNQSDKTSKKRVIPGYSPNCYNVNSKACNSSIGSSSSYVPASPIMRRSSFLSESMMREVHNSFVSGVAEDGSAKYSLSVKESQGYQWNPSLFAPHYSKYEYDESDFTGPNCPEVQEIIVDETEDIFPSDY